MFKTKCAIFTYTVILLTFFSCNLQSDTDSNYLPLNYKKSNKSITRELNDNEKKLNQFFVSMHNTPIETEFYACKGSIKKLEEFYKRHNIQNNINELRSSKLKSRQSCTGNECDINYIGKMLTPSAFQLSSQSWRAMWVQEIFNEIKNNSINIGYGIIVIFGNGACPYANASAIKGRTINKGKYYLIGNSGYHSCVASQNAFPFFLYQDMLITDQLGCMNPDEISLNSIALCSQLGYIPIISSINEDGSGIRPGAYKIQYGKDGLGTPTGGTDAKIEMYSATVDGVK